MKKQTTKKEIIRIINKENAKVYECNNMHLIEIMCNYEPEELGNNFGQYGLNWSAYKTYYTNLETLEKSCIIFLYNCYRNMPEIDGKLTYDPRKDAYVRLYKKTESKLIGYISTIQEELCYQQTKLIEELKDIEKMYKEGASLRDMSRATKKNIEISEKLEKIENQFKLYAPCELTKFIFCEYYKIQKW